MLALVLALVVVLVVVLALVVVLVLVLVLVLESMWCMCRGCRGSWLECDCNSSYTRHQLPRLILQCTLRCLYQSSAGLDWLRWPCAHQALQH